MNHGIHYVSILIERLSSSPIAYSQIVAQQRSMSKFTIIVNQLVAFFNQCFSVFFHRMRPSNVYCRRPSCLNLGTTQVIKPQSISDPVSNTHQISIWSPSTLLYHDWLLIRSRTPIRSRFGHRPRHYTAIDFSSGLAHTSEAKSSVISKMSLSQYYMFRV